MRGDNITRGENEERDCTDGHDRHQDFAGPSRYAECRGC